MRNGETYSPNSADARCLRAVLDRGSDSRSSAAVRGVDLTSIEADPAPIAPCGRAGHAEPGAGRSPSSSAPPLRRRLIRNQRQRSAHHTPPAKRFSGSARESSEFATTHQDRAAQDSSPATNAPGLASAEERGGGPRR